MVFFFLFFLNLSTFTPRIAEIVINDSSTNYPAVIKYRYCDSLTLTFTLKNTVERVMQSDFMFNFKAVGPETMAAQDDKSVLEALAHHKIFV